MRYSANLNVIIKAIEKATARISRDFIELENLQTNPASASKFANACYSRIKEVLAEDLLKLRPEYNLIFSDGQKIINRQNAEYSYVIFPVDGFTNLLHSNPDFTISVALEHVNANGQKEGISAAIYKLVGGEFYYCEKGFGAYLNNRRIRVSKRSTNEIPLVVSEDQNFFKKELLQKLNLKTVSHRAYGCRTMELAYLASAKLEMLMLEKQNEELIKPFLLLIREAGGKVFEDEKFILASNGLISL